MFPFPIQLLANVHPEKQQVIAQVLGSLPPMWETWTEFLSLAWPSCSCGHLRNKPRDENSFAFQKKKKENKTNKKFQKFVN